MSDSKLKIDIRRQKLLEVLRQEGRISVAEVSRQLGTTPVTIRSDLTALEQDGCLVRVQGGAIPVPNQKGRTNHSTTANMEEKKTIGITMARMLHDGDTLFINSGTTTEQVAAALEIRANINIVTNSLSVATILAEIPSLRVILLGGEVNAQYGFTYGSDALTQLDKYKADWAILSVDGVSAEYGITTLHAEEAVIDRMMMSNARKIWIVADHTKIGKAGFARVRDTIDGIGVVTGNRCEEAEALTERGMQVVFAED